MAQRNKYDEARVVEVTRPIMAGEKTIAERARETGIKPSTISGMVKRERLKEDLARSSSSEHEEIHKLRKENFELIEQNKLLEKENEFFLTQYLAWRKIRNKHIGRL